MESEDLLSRISEVHPNQVWLDKEKVEKRYIYLFFADCKIKLDN